MHGALTIGKAGGGVADGQDRDQVQQRDFRSPRLNVAAGRRGEAKGSVLGNARGAFAHRSRFRDEADLHRLERVHDPKAEKIRAEAHIGALLDRSVGRDARPAELHVPPVVHLAPRLSKGAPSLSESNLLAADAVPVGLEGLHLLLVVEALRLALGIVVQTEPAREGEG